MFNKCNPVSVGISYSLQCIIREQAFCTNCKKYQQILKLAQKNKRCKFFSTTHIKNHGQLQFEIVFIGRIKAN